MPLPDVRAIELDVVAHHGPHRDALGAEPDQHPIQEVQGVTFPVSGAPLGVGRPRVVIDGRGTFCQPVRGLRVTLSRQIRLPGVPQAAQFLGVQVRQLPGVPRSEPTTESAGRAGGPRSGFARLRCALVSNLRCGRDRGTRQHTARRPVRPARLQNPGCRQAQDPDMMVLH